jgi:hypothetical protein
MAVAVQPKQQQQTPYATLFQNIFWVIFITLGMQFGFVSIGGRFLHYEVHSSKMHKYYSSINPLMGGCVHWIYISCFS